MSLMFAQYFDYYSIILRGRFSVNTVYILKFAVSEIFPETSTFAVAKHISLLHSPGNAYAMKTGLMLRSDKNHEVIS